MAKTTKTLSEKMKAVDTSSAMYAMDVMDEELDINVKPKKKAKSTKKVKAEDIAETAIPAETLNDSKPIDIDISSDEFIENVTRAAYAMNDEYADLSRKVMFLNTANLVGKVIEIPYLKFVNKNGVLFKDNIMSISPICTDKYIWDKKLPFRGEIFAHRYLGCIGIQFLKNWNMYRDNIAIDKYPASDVKLAEIYTNTVAALTKHNGDIIESTMILNGKYPFMKDDELVDAVMMSIGKEFTIGDVVRLIEVFGFNDNVTLLPVLTEKEKGCKFNPRTDLEIIGQAIRECHEDNAYSTAYKYFCKANPSLTVPKWVEFTNASIAAIRHIAFIEMVTQNKNFRKSVSGTFLPRW